MTSTRDPGSRPAADPALPGVGILGIGVLGLVLGLAATAIVLGRGWDPGAVAVGPWVVHPGIGTTAIDPYAQAELARSGAVPMSASEGLSFTATTDDTGFRLLRTCTYRFTGGTPPARFWTLTATDRDGLAFEGPDQRSGFTSTTVVRDDAGRFAIEIGRQARPGNWLPVTGDGPLTLTLRLYDTPLTIDTTEILGASRPGLARQSCGADG